MKVSLWISVFLFAFGILSCKKDLDFQNSGELGFSADTVKIDTIFTTFPSPTYRLFVYNKMNYPLEISEIQLENGEQSEFQVIVDGVKGTYFQKVQLNSKDSIYIFVSLKSNQQQKQVEDKLLFKLSNSQQTVVLSAFVLDAYFYRGVDSLYSFPCNFIMPNDKPNIIDGLVYVPENCTLTIAAGTEIRFSSIKDAYATPVSQILVDGTLIVQGSSSAKVVFDSWRLDENYQEGSGQWHGIRFLKNSKNSKIQHAILKNGNIAVQVDSMSYTPEPKVLIEQTEIRNFSNFGILGVGAHQQSLVPSIVAINTLVTNCGQNNVGLYFGGNYEFYHCTLANYSNEFRRSEPVLAISDYLEYEENGQGIRNIYPTKVYFANSIIWGSEEQEWKFDLKGTQGTILFEHCVVRSKSDYPVPGNNNFVNNDPKFKNQFERDYSLDSTSICIDNGKNDFNIFQDILGNNRVQLPDIGAFEYLP